VNILPRMCSPRHRAHRRDGRAWPRRSRTGACLRDRGQRVLRGRRRSRLRPAVGQHLADLRAGHRGDVEPDKRDPADFALWKAAGPRRSLKWPTARWGDGLPGLAPRVLGDGDALPRRRSSTSTPAASTTSSPTTRTRSPSPTPIGGGRPAGIWVHGELLLMAGRKMAKSAGNFQARDRADRCAAPTRSPSGLPRPRPHGYGPQARITRTAPLEAVRGRPRPRCEPGCATLGAATVRRARGWRRQVLRGGRRRGSSTGRQAVADATRPATARPTTPIADRAHAPTPRCSGAGRASLHDRFVGAAGRRPRHARRPLRVRPRDPAGADFGAIERRWLILDADAVLGLDPRPGVGRAADAGRHVARHRRGHRDASRTGDGSRQLATTATRRSHCACRDRGRSAGTSSTVPSGSSGPPPLAGPDGGARPLARPFSRAEQAGRVATRTGR
jgi:hypothetical protein